MQFTIIHLLGPVIKLEGLARKSISLISKTQCVCFCVRVDHMCPHLVTACRDSSCFRCWESSFFSRDRRIQALARPTSVLISDMLWICLRRQKKGGWRLGRTGTTPWRSTLIPNHKNIYVYVGSRNVIVRIFWCEQDDGKVFKHLV